MPAWGSRSLASLHVNAASFQAGAASPLLWARTAAMPESSSGPSPVPARPAALPTSPSSIGGHATSWTEGWPRSIRTRKLTRSPTGTPPHSDTGTWRSREKSARASGQSTKPQPAAVWSDLRVPTKTAWSTRSSAIERALAASLAPSADISSLILRCTMRPAEALAEDERAGAAAGRSPGPGAGRLPPHTAAIGRAPRPRLPEEGRGTTSPGGEGRRPHRRAPA
mmetsp:Transcript_57150/g.179425  ORF Transcript_57150/g.179425 Transcript_57150/m.179425 type:complete len:224 (-) Transcript_57150:12-683(-)